MKRFMKRFLDETSQLPGVHVSWKCAVGAWKPRVFLRYKTIQRYRCYKRPHCHAGCSTHSVALLLQHTFMSITT